MQSFLKRLENFLSSGVEFPVKFATVVLYSPPQGSRLLDVKMSTAYWIWGGLRVHIASLCRQCKVSCIGIILQLPLPYLHWGNPLISWCTHSRVASGSPRYALSCFHTQRLPWLASKTFSPYLELALRDRKLWGLHHWFVTRFIHHLAEQTGLPSTVTPLHFQRLQDTTSQRDALLALLKIDFIQKSWMIIWLFISCFLEDKGWCAHHTCKFMLCEGDLLHLLANTMLRLLSLLVYYLTSSTKHLPTQGSLSACLCYLLLQRSVSQCNGGNIFRDPCLPVCLTDA